MRADNDNGPRVYTLEEAAGMAEKLGIDVDYMLNYEVSIWREDPQMAGVYVFACENFVKIGVAKDPVKRLAQMQSCNPFPLRLTRFRLIGETGFALLAERVAHGVLAKHAVRREWFLCDAESANVLVDIVSVIARESAIRSGRLYAREAA